MSAPKSLDVDTTAVQNSDSYDTKDTLPHLANTETMKDKTTQTLPINEMSDVLQDVSNDIGNTREKNSQSFEHKADETVGGREEKDDEEEDDEEEDDEEEEEEEEEEEITPPPFKYKRLTSLPPRFFNKDPVSCTLLHKDLYIFATHSGIIFICNTEFKQIKLFKAHTSSIFALDFDGEYFASCSMDGTVLIGHVNMNNQSDIIINDSELVKYNFSRPIHAVALQKPYSRTKSFFCGGTSGDLIHCTKNWLKQRVDTVLDKDGECITVIKSENDLLIWCNSKGITIAQINTQKQLLHISVPKNMNRPELYWPKIQFIEDDEILIGWLTHVWYLKIHNEINENRNTFESKVLSSAASSFKLHYDEKQVELIYKVNLPDCLIAGISEYNNNLMILNYLPKVGKDEYFPPELKILDGVTFEEISIDELVLRNYESLGMNDFQLLENSNIEQNRRRWFLISSNDAIIIEPYDMNDKIAWYVDKKNYYDAWRIGKSWLDKFERLELGEKQVSKWFEDKSWDKMTSLLVEVLDLDNLDSFTDDDEKLEYTSLIIKLWNKWLKLLLESNILSSYPEIFPTEKFDCSDQIESEYYEFILNNFLMKRDYENFMKYFNSWDHSLFDLKDIQIYLNEIIEEYDDASEQIKPLRKCYINLCLELDDPKCCVQQMLVLSDDKLMEFLDEYHLINFYLDILPKIVLIGVNREYLKSKDFDKLQENTRLYTNIEILVENSHEVLPSKILKIFKDNDLEIINYIYLKELGKIDSHLIKDFEDEMINLYAEFNKSELSRFLKDHKKYSIDEAIQVCERFECTEELVYLLSKIGENRKALVLIIDKMEDPIKAIHFVQRVNEKELWDFLLDYSMDKSKFIKELLISVGSLVDPIPVVTRIPCQVEIENLKNILVNICKNVTLDKTIYDITMDIVCDGFMERSEKLRQLKMMGYTVDGEELALVGDDINSTFLKIKDHNGERLVTEQALLGQRWKGNPKDKIAHKSYLKFKLK